MSQDDETPQEQLGETDSPVEDDLEEAFVSQVTGGTQKLHRTWREIAVTGFLGGVDVGVGVTALLLVVDATGSQLLGGLAFGIGFLTLLLGRGELLTEGFIVPVMTVAAGRASLLQLLRLWTGTFVFNLVGGWLMMWLVMTALPRLADTVGKSAAHFSHAPLSMETAALAFVAGAVITLMTRMHHGTDEDVAKIVAAFAAGFLLAGAELFHSVLDSLIIFGALHAGTGDVTVGQWAIFVAWVVPLNLLGGFLMVALPRIIRSWDRLRLERRAAAQGLPVGELPDEPGGGREAGGRGASGLPSGA